MNTTPSNYQAYVSMFQKDFPPEEFAERRGKILDSIGEGAHALLQGAGPGRGFTIFRQTNEFYYCSGVELPQAYLLFGGPQRKTNLYLPSRGKEQTSEGTVLGAEDAEVIKHFTGVDEVFGIEKMAEHLADVSVLYTPHSPAETRGTTRWDLLMADKQAAGDPWDGLPSREQRYIGLLKTRFPKIEVHNLSPVIDGYQESGRDCRHASGRSFVRAGCSRGDAGDSTGRH
jgi:Xaa-Pro aminopeptidase